VSTEPAAAQTLGADDLADIVLRRHVLDDVIQHLTLSVVSLAMGGV
jgi:hypothetical protein